MCLPNLLYRMQASFSKARAYAAIFQWCFQERPLHAISLFVVVLAFRIFIGLKIMSMVFFTIMVKLSRLDPTATHLFVGYIVCFVLHLKPIPFLNGIEINHSSKDLR